MATNLGSLARLMQDCGDLTAAESVFREALDIRRETLGDNHPDTATFMNWLALLLEEQGKLAEAEPLFLQAVRTCQETLPSGNWRTGTYHINYGSCLTGLQRFEDAEGHLLQGYTLLEAAFGRDDSRTQTALSSLVELYDVWGRPDKADEYRAMLPNSPEAESTSRP